MAPRQREARWSRAPIPCLWRHLAVERCPSSCWMVGDRLPHLKACGAQSMLRFGQTKALNCRNPSQFRGWRGWSRCRLSGRTACGNLERGFGRVSIGTRCHEPYEDEQSEQTASDRECNRARAQAAAGHRCLSEMARPRLPVPEPLSSWLVWVGYKPRNCGVLIGQPPQPLRQAGELSCLLSVVR